MNEIEEFFLMHLDKKKKEEEGYRRSTKIFYFTHTTTRIKSNLRLLLTTINQSIQKSEEAKSNRIEPYMNEWMYWLSLYIMSQSIALTLTQKTV